jgi:hypothetical protein
VVTPVDLSAWRVAADARPGMCVYPEAVGRPQAPPWQPLSRTPDRNRVRINRLLESTVRALAEAEPPF